MRERRRFLCRPQLLIVDDIGYLPVVPGGGNLFFQLVNARYKRGAMTTLQTAALPIGARSSDIPFATALLGRLHHAAGAAAVGLALRPTELLVSGARLAALR